MSENHFAKALKNFTMDAAAGDAIRHLTDKGYTFSQVKESLTFPAPDEYIAQVMWEELIATLKVLPEGDLHDPLSGATGSGSDTEIVEQFDRWGRKSFLRIKKESPEEMKYSPEDYVQYNDLLVLKHAQEQVFSLSDHIPLKVRNTGSHRDM